MSILGQVANTKANPVVYQVPAGKSALITKIWLYDDEANVGRSYLVRCVRSGQAEGDRHNLIHTTAIADDLGGSSGGGIEIQMPLTLGPGDQITVVPGVAGALPDSVTVFGEEATDTGTYATPLPNTLVGTALTSVYTVPAGKQLAVSALVLANTGSATRRVWLSFAKAGAADAASQYVLVNYRLDPQDVYTFVGGMTLDAGDVVRCKTDVADGVAISIHGVVR